MTDPASKTPVQEALDTRTRIVAAAADLFAEKGYNGASLREIADRVGIRTPSLFYHFKSKGELYQAILETIFGDLNEVIEGALRAEGGYEERLVVLADAYTRHTARHRNFSMMFFREMLDNRDGLQETSRRYIFPSVERVARFLREGQAAGAFREVDPLHFIMSFIGMTVYYYAAAPIISPLTSEHVFAPGAIDARAAHVID
ncbi:MAG: TetR/AcrR family transcriptional regulator, partial [Myxococcales bacterium]|nr:TetR/AcrR family transcriptional regulator [Myxococcales bacterium]